MRSNSYFGLLERSCKLSEIPHSYPSSLHSSFLIRISKSSKLIPEPNFSLVRMYILYIPVYGGRYVLHGGSTETVYSVYCTVLYCIYQYQVPASNESDLQRKNLTVAFYTLMSLCFLMFDGRRITTAGVLLFLVDPTNRAARERERLQILFFGIWVR